MLLECFHPIRSARQSTESVEFNRCFAGLLASVLTKTGGDHSTFLKNCERLLEGDIAAKPSTAATAQPRVKRLLGTDHLPVDGMLIEVWASMRLGVNELRCQLRVSDEGLCPRAKTRGRFGTKPPTAAGGNREVDFHGQKRLNADGRLHQLDPEARLGSQGTGQGGQLGLDGTCADGETGTASSSTHFSSRPVAMPSGSLCCT